jgi:hypothetical protein
MKTKISQPTDNSKEFLLEFFKDSNIEDKNGVLTISEVPQEFEKFLGKKAPYKFVFDINLHNKIIDSELIMQGSYFLLAIRDYLRDKGQTSLLKIHPDIKEVSKSPSLKKYNILEINPCENNYLYEFYFLSTYQYLNDKKQSTSKIFILNNEILEIDIKKFKFNKGNKDEISNLDPSEQYKTAKKVLDEKVKKETKSIKLILKNKLEKELFRVKNHYFKQIKEKDEEIETCANKIRLLQSKLRHTSYERDRNVILRMIHESEERLEMLRKKSYKERLHAEEIFHINDEVEKHALSIKNILINITIYYYPILEVQAKSKNKRVILKYDPVLDKVFN